ncbi:hypothetical protein NECAME_11018 [Necator americanus]|uniref:Uncharacterized protein n=1 Tax=Necator americanus TaxID=51031 RepID=W2T602_NECAM|nr:hypothetical protein NECAME_11018 [Necator americanus]ETN77445.1 hypothetical protein NECAME_11018 [Necator americanus]
MEAEAEIEALQSIFGDDITVEANCDRSVTVVRRKVRPNGEEGVSSASVVAEFELSLESLRCPVCREVIQEEIEPLLQPSPPPRRKNNSSLDGSKTTPCDLFHQGSECDFDFDWKRKKHAHDESKKAVHDLRTKNGLVAALKRRWIQETNTVLLQCKK